MFCYIRISLDRISTPSVVASIQQLEDVTKHLGTVTSVNLLDNQGYFLLRVHPGLLVSLQEGLLHELISQVLGAFYLMWLVAAYKRSIVAIRMEGSTDAGNLSFILFLLDGMRFTGTRSTIVDDLARGEISEFQGAILWFFHWHIRIAFQQVDKCIIELFEVLIWFLTII